MKRRPMARPQRPTGPNFVLESVAGWVVAVAAGLIPLFYWGNANNEYRLPKEMLLRTTGIVVVTLLLIALVWRGHSAWRTWPLQRDALLLIAAIVCWSTITALVASNRAVSMDALATIVVCAAIAAGSLVVAQKLPFAALLPLMIGATLTSISCLLALVIRKPSLYWGSQQGRAYALLGSPHDAGAFLVFPAIAATAAAVADRQRRWWWAAAAVMCVAAIGATRTVGAMAGYAAGAFVLVLLRSRRMAIALALIGVIMMGALLGVAPGLRHRLGRAARGDLIAMDDLASGRVVAFIAAWRMFAAHPLLGVGPACFRWDYYPIKIEVEGDYPLLQYSAAREGKFGQAHSDHLQILAENGFPGYALFVSALVLVGRASRRAGEARDRRARFARTAAAPMAAAFCILSAGEFPLEIAASLLPMLFLAAVCVAWSRIDALS